MKKYIIFLLITLIVLVPACDDSFNNDFKEASDTEYSVDDTSDNNNSNNSNNNNNNLNNTNNTNNTNNLNNDNNNGDAEAVSLDTQNLEIGFNGDDSANSVTLNVILPTTGSNGTNISWESDNPSFIATDGTVTRPGIQNRTVILTATITRGSSSDTKQFTLVVIMAVPFITRWQTDNVGYTFSSDNQVKLPLSSNGTYNFTVDWGDGTGDTITSFDQFETIHTYTVPGQYTIRMTGTIEGFGFSQSGEDNSKLIDVVQWGSVQLHNDGSQFINCNYLTGFTASDALALSNISNMDSMFSGALSFNGEISSWDVSTVTNMGSMFFGAAAFNGDISNWDVSNVTSMWSMFSGAASFNQNLSAWNVSSVDNMDSMFSGATAFNGDISTWDVSNVTSMWSMFSGAVLFNRNLFTWSVSNVTVMDSMFSGATAFNGNISTWDVSNVTSMHSMFRNALVFNGNISNWDVSSVINMDSMFFDAINFAQDLRGWCVSGLSTPDNFNTGSALILVPIWGTCP